VKYSGVGDYFFEEKMIPDTFWKITKIFSLFARIKGIN